MRSAIESKLDDLYRLMAADESKSCVLNIPLAPGKSDEKLTHLSKYSPQLSSRDYSFHNIINCRLGTLILDCDDVHDVIRVV